MGLQPVDNLRSFVTSRPPLVVFMVCLGMFAVALMSLSYYVKVNQVANPDITQDWNTFLRSVSDLDFCVTGNYSDPSSAVPPIALDMPRVKQVSTISPAQSLTTKQMLEYEGPRNYSVSLLLTIRPTVEFLNIPHNVTKLYGSLYGRNLGLQGLAAEEQINITAELPYNWTGHQCQGSLGCQEVQILTCVTFQGSPYVFPTSPSPEVCMGLNETGIEYNARIVPNVKQKHSMFPKFYCKARPVIHVKYMYNPSLAVWLSMHDRSVINLHLMHTSYFLFVMVITLLCYAIIRGGPLKSVKYSVHIDSGNTKL